MQRRISLEISPPPPPPPFLITLLYIKGFLKFNEEEEERCPKTSPLTFSRVLKALMESEESKRRVKPTKKINRSNIEEQRG